MLYGEVVVHPLEREPYLHRLKVCFPSVFFSLSRGDKHPVTFHLNYYFYPDAGHGA